jgi:hypothetical protein
MAGVVNNGLGQDNGIHRCLPHCSICAQAWQQKTRLPPRAYCGVFWCIFLRALGAWPGFWGHGFAKITSFLGILILFLSLARSVCCFALPGFF